MNKLNIDVKISVPINKTSMVLSDRLPLYEVKDLGWICVRIRVGLLRDEIIGQVFLISSPFCSRKISRKQSFMVNLKKTRIWNKKGILEDDYKVVTTDYTSMHNDCNSLSSLCKCCTLPRQLVLARQGVTQLLAGHSSSSQSQGVTHQQPSK